MADYNLVRLETLNAVDTVGEEDLLLVNRKNDDGTFSSVKISGNQSFTAANIKLNSTVRSSFSSLLVDGTTSRCTVGNLAYGCQNAMILKHSPS